MADIDAQGVAALRLIADALAVSLPGFAVKLRAVAARYEVIAGRMADTSGGARFAETHCSQCGAQFGPGDHGYSHCNDHR